MNMAHILFTGSVLLIYLYAVATIYIFARVRILGTLVSLNVIGNSVKFPITSKKTQAALFQFLSVSMFLLHLLFFYNLVYITSAVFQARHACSDLVQIIQIDLSDDNACFFRSARNNSPPRVNYHAGAIGCC